MNSFANEEYLFINKFNGRVSLIDLNLQPSSVIKQENVEVSPVMTQKQELSSELDNIYNEEIVLKEDKTKKDNVNELIEQLAVTSIKVSGNAGCKHIIIRPLFSGIKKQELWEVNRDYYLRLSKVAKDNNVVILLENQAFNYNGHLVRGICSDPGEAITWVDKLNKEVGSECFGFCLNVGTCNICGQDMYDFITSIGNRLKAVILRDSDGHNEASLLPFTSVSSFNSHTDWLSVIRGLRAIEFEGELIFDFEDTASSVSPILRPELLKFSNSIAEYFKWQLDIERKLKQYKHIVLFGAGNMFKNYMRCHGKKYPPLFTCDNNEKMWGEKLFGVEVKAPEALKNIPNDCGIFICNMYYTEIQNQLRDIGIENNIEFFSDEYMPFLINKGCED